MDKDWEKATFLDRNHPDNKDQPIHKKLELKRFGIYWNS